MLLSLHLILTDLLNITQILFFYCHFSSLRNLLKFESFRCLIILFSKVIYVIVVKWSLNIFNRFWLTFSHIFLLAFLSFADPIEILYLCNEWLHKITLFKNIFYSQMDLYMNERFLKILSQRPSTLFSNNDLLMSLVFSNSKNLIKGVWLKRLHVFKQQHLLIISNVIVHPPQGLTKSTVEVVLYIVVAATNHLLGDLCPTISMNLLKLKKKGFLSSCPFRLLADVWMQLIEPSLATLFPLSVLVFWKFANFESDLIPLHFLPIFIPGVLFHDLDE